MKIALKIAVLMTVAGLFFGCAGTRSFGPYSGKVVDAETNAPIEGAVVFFQFYTDAQLSPAGPVQQYIDALELMTDSNGEFNIPTYKVKTFRPFEVWQPHAQIKIFMPGYGLCPDHKGTSPKIIPEGEYVLIKLPKLASQEERKRNIGSIHFDAPEQKRKNFNRLIDIEGVDLGLDPMYQGNK